MQLRLSWAGAPATPRVGSAPTLAAGTGNYLRAVTLCLARHYIREVMVGEEGGDRHTCLHKVMEEQKANLEQQADRLRVSRKRPIGDG